MKTLGQLVEEGNIGGFVLRFQGKLGESAFARCRPDEVWELCDEQSQHLITVAPTEKALAEHVAVANQDLRDAGTISVDETLTVVPVAAWFGMYIQVDGKKVEKKLVARSASNGNALYMSVATWRKDRLDYINSQRKMLAKQIKDEHSVFNREVKSAAKTYRVEMHRLSSDLKHALRGYANEAKYYDAEEAVIRGDGKTKAKRTVKKRKAKKKPTRKAATRKKRRTKRKG